MPTFLEHIGGLLDRWKGPRYTRVYKDTSVTETHHLKSTIFDDDFQATITSRRIMYLTTYRNWWVPNKRQLVYEVVCEAADEVKAKLPPDFFKPVVYPLLCNRMLMRTPYPHRYAIAAFMGQMPHHTEVVDLQA
jgi:hypothetical protein